MIEPTKPVSPIFPIETTVESGRVVPGLAGGDARVEVEGAGTEEERELAFQRELAGRLSPDELAFQRELAERFRRPAEAEAKPDDDAEETLPPKRQASPEQPTASEVADHETTHLNYRAWCPDCVEAFGRERAHHVYDTTGRVVPLIAVDYCFLTDKGIVFRNEVDYDWDSAPDSVLKLLAGRCSKSGD